MEIENIYSVFKKKKRKLINNKELNFFECRWSRLFTVHYISTSSVCLSLYLVRLLL